MKSNGFKKAEFGSMGITDQCMLRCRMCYKWQPDIFISDMDLKHMPLLKHYQKLINGLTEVVTDDFVLNLGGGEALLHKDIYEVIAIASKAGLRTNLVSNGYLIDDKIAKRLAAAGLSTVKLSLDSTNKQIHDFLRGVDGVYDRLIKAIDNLYSIAPSIEIGLNTVIYELNYTGIIELVEWVNNNIKIKDVALTVAMQPNNTLPQEQWWEGKYSFLWPKDKQSVSGLLDKLINLKAKGYKINNNIAQLRAIKNYLADPASFVKKRECNMDKAIHISSIGKIYHCFLFEPIGDIRQLDDIRLIWESEKAREIRRNIKACKKNCHFLINCFFEED